MKKNTKLCLTAAAFLAFQLSSGFLLAQTDPSQNVPKLEGTPFKEIKYETEPQFVKADDKEKIEKEVRKGPAPKVTATPPKTRTRGNDISGGGRSVFQFTNWDFPVTGTTCGQAAAATAMWNVGLKQTWNNNASDFARQLYNYAPPKITIGGVVNLGSSLGTDWRQMSYAFDGYKKYGIKYGWFKGRDLLNKYIDMGLPCIIMMDMGVFGANLWGRGHWVVAYGRDNNGYYVTNNSSNYLSWNDLNRAWGGVWNEGHLAKAHGTGEMFCVVWK